MGEAEEDFLAECVGGVVGTAGAVDQLLDAAFQVVLVQAGGALFKVLPDLVQVTAAAAMSAADLLEGLIVRPDAMQANLAITQGLSMAEAVMMALAAHVGKPQAHALVERAARRALAEGRPFADSLEGDPEISRWLDRRGIEDALRPEDYLGVSAQFVARVLAAAASRTTP